MLYPESHLGRYSHKIEVHPRSTHYPFPNLPMLVIHHVIVNRLQIFSGSLDLFLLKPVLDLGRHVAMSTWAMARDLLCELLGVHDFKLLIAGSRLDVTAQNSCLEHNVNTSRTPSLNVRSPDCTFLFQSKDAFQINIVASGKRHSLAMENGSIEKQRCQSSMRSCFVAFTRSSLKMSLASLAVAANQSSRCCGHPPILPMWSLIRSLKNAWPTPACYTMQS